MGNWARFFFIHSLDGSYENLVAQPPFPSTLILATGHFWSLCVEEQFYLVWPFIIFTVRKRELLRNTCAILALLCLAARIAGYILLPRDLVQAQILGRLTPFTADALCMGGLVALCMRGPEARHLLKWSRPLLTLLLTFFVVFELTHIATSPNHKAYRPDLGAPILATVGYSLVDLFGAALVAALLTPRGFLFRLFHLSWLRRLGQVSYGFYIFHVMFHPLYGDLAHRLTHHRGASTNLTATLGFFGTLILSFLSYRYFETPFLRLKRRFAPTPA